MAESSIPLAWFLDASQSRAERLVTIRLMQAALRMPPPTREVYQVFFFPGILHDAHGEPLALGITTTN